MMKKSNWRLILSLLTGSLFLCIAMPVHSAPKASMILLYTATPNDSAEEYENLLDTAQFALDTYETETKNKVAIKLTAIDDKDDPQHAQKVLQKAIAAEKPVAIIGPLYSNVALNLKDFVNKN